MCMATTPTINSPEADFLSPLHFSMTVSRLPNVSFMLTRVVVPGVSVDEVSLATPFTSLPLPADHMQFDELELAYKVDANATNWKQMFDWMTGIAFPSGFGQRVDVEPNKIVRDLYSDISIILFDYHKHPAIQWDFHDTLPVSMSPVLLDVSTQGVKYVESTVRLVYRDFTMKNLSTS